MRNLEPLDTLLESLYYDWDKLNVKELDKPLLAPYNLVYEY